jgi:hypothetical protein
MAANFGHNGHHQAISQKPNKAGTYGAKYQFISDPIYIYINIY